MIKKIFVLSQKEIETIEETKNQNGFLSNDSAVIRYIISEYANMKKKEIEEISQKVLLAIQRDSEEKLNRLLDTANTILVLNKIETCIPASYMESPVITKSREYEKERKGQLKQKKDYRNKKRR